MELTTATLGAHSVFKTRLHAAFVSILNNHHPPKARTVNCSVFLGSGWVKPPSIYLYLHNHTHPNTRKPEITPPPYLLTTTTTKTFKNKNLQGVKPAPPEEKARLITTYCDRLLRVGGAAEEQRVSEVLGLVVYLKVRVFSFVCGFGGWGKSMDGCAC